MNYLIINLIICIVIPEVEREKKRKRRGTNISEEDVIVALIEAIRAGLAQYEKAGDDVRQYVLNFRLALVNLFIICVHMMNIML